MNKINVFIAVFLSAWVTSFSQTAEPGKAFNRFMSPQSGVNLLSGTVAFSKPLAQISSGNVSTSLELAYSGNVFREVQSRNDISPGSWVGLGWALGRAAILCDHRGTIPNDDDSYSLVLPTGVRYQFVRDNIDRNKWWIEQQPYWQVERITKTAILSGKSYAIVVGWKIVNESGLIGYYGDYDENLLNPKRNATQHDLSWPSGPGLVGYAAGGATALHPSAWNLSRQEDLEGNWIEYDYEQVFEKISVRDWTSDHGYTKESYLKEVRTSTGSSMKLILEDKGHGDFQGEYWDSRGKFEEPDSPPDAFIDPLERKFLSAIEIFGMDGKKTGRIDLCYKALKISIAGEDANGYTKRLLASVIHTDADGIEVDREDYDYYTESEKASKSTKEGIRREHLGALYRIRGSNCGLVEYTYSHFSLSQNRNGGIESHAQTIDIGSKHLQMGYLSDGTQYLVGMDNNGNVKVYGLFGGLWVQTPLQGSFNVSNAEDASILIGDKGWFAITQSGNIIPAVWDSEKWVVGETLNAGSSQERVWTGPDYLIHTRASNNKLTLEIPWSRWGKTYTYTIPHVDVSKWDRELIVVSAARNHILISYIRNDVFTPNSKAVMVLTFSGDNLVETEFTDDIDNDSKYYLSGDYFYGLEEARDLVGYYSSAWHWNGNSWNKWLSRENLNGWQGELYLQAYGTDYYAVRHNDDDDITLFNWDGEYWSRPYKNKNMVDNDNFDLFVESLWHGHNGNDFFVVTHPRNIWEKQRVCLLARPKLWGLKCVLHVDVPYWQTTYRHARVTRFEKRDGAWSTTGSSTLDCPKTEKEILTGQDWYTERKCAERAWIWDSQNWREEKIDADTLKNAESLGSGFFYKKQSNNNTQVRIYRKIDDSFIEPFGAFVVTEKRFSDPVVDQSNVYAYSYIFAANQDGGYAFDGPNNTPLVDKVTITLPENAGALRQIMCSPRDNGRAGMGQVCEEENLDAKGNFVGKTKYFYGRFRSSGWPYEIYVDRLDSVKGVSGGMRIESKTNYNVLNGLPFKIVEVSGSKRRETRTIYAAEHYSALKNANRLSEVTASYTCLPSCDANGKISQAGAVRYGIVPGANILYAFENWNWEPATVQAGNSFSFNWNTSTQNNVWKKASAVTRFDRGRPVESIDRLGLYSALFNESNEAGLPYAKVTGSKRNAVLLIPGESCEISGLTDCNLAMLQGNATQGSGLGYGRFSATALLSPVTASLAASTGGLYRFSAWVQGVDMSGHTLQLSFNGQNVQQWTIAGTNAGNWQRVQWEGTLHTGVVNVALSAQGSPIRVQDMRLQPYEALSSVTFWDRHQGIPLVQVDERGVGSYVKLDAAGRVKARYMEDEAGKVFLSQQLDYASANCKDNGHGTNRLSMLRINGISVPLSEELVYVLPDGEREFSAKWMLFQKRDKIRYQLYPEGQGANTEWISACCGEIEAASGDAAVLNWTLRLDVEPFSSSGQADYTIHIRKDTTGWTDHGGPPSAGVGSSGRYTGNHDSGRLVFVDNATSMILKEATFDGNAWQSLAIPNVRPEEFHVAGKGNSRYLVQLPINTGEKDTIYGSFFGNTGYAWSEYGIFAEEENTDLLRVAVDGQNRPWVLYRRARTEHDPGSLQAVRWNVAQNKWEKAGSLPVFNLADTLPPTAFLPGRISERLPEDADIVSGSNGNMYVAYIGSIASIGRDSISPSSDSAALRVVVVKRLYGAEESRMNHEIWAGPSLLEDQDSSGAIPEYDGDILTMDSTVLIGARRVRMASDGEHIYLAIAYSVETNQDGMLAVTVFKGSMRHLVTEEGIEYRSKLVFEPLADTSVKGSALGVPFKDERNRAFYLKSSEPFDFVVRQGTPYLAFANSANRQKLTVIYHTGSRWLSVGNPAFAPLSPESGQLNMSVDSLKKPYVVFKEGLKSKNTKQRNRVVPMKYVATGDRNMTLNAVGFSGAETSLSSEFRQYILNYQASFDATATSLSLSPSPMAISDIVGIQVENNGSLIGSWVISPNSSEADLYMQVAVVNYSGTSIPAFEVPLAEGLNVVEVKVFGKNGKQLIYTFELSREFLPSPGLGISGGKSDEGPVCIWFSTGWFLKCGNDVYYSNTCFESNFEDALECELSGGGTTIPVVIKPGGGNEGSGGGGDNGSGVIPPELRPWSGYSLFAVTNLNFADRVIVERGPVAAGSMVEAGVESEIRSEELISRGDVWLRNRARVRNIILSGELHTQHEATYTGVEYKSVNLPALPVLAVHTGTENITAGNNQRISVEPGSYGNFHAYSRSVVSFASGDYHFSSFILEPDAKLELGVSEHGVRIWVQGELRLADRVVLENPGTPEKFLLYTNSNGHIRLGTDNALRAIVVAPIGTVEIPSRVTYTSSIWAKNIIVQPDVQFPGN